MEENKNLEAALDAAAGTEEKASANEAAGNIEEKQTKEDRIKELVQRQNDCRDKVMEVLEQYGCRISASLTINDLGQVYSSFKIVIAEE